LLVRVAFVQQAIDDAVILPLHCDSAYLPADMLTKVMTRLLNERHMRRIGMVCLERGSRATAAQGSITAVANEARRK
jgi:hypothetical protein